MRGLKRLVLFAMLVTGCVVHASAAATAREGAVNRIVLENRHAGSAGWNIPWAGYTISDDINLQIKGYAGAESVAPGGVLPLKVDVHPAQHFSVDVFRLGDYQGLGGRWMAHLGDLAGVPQPPCGLDRKTLMNRCEWNTAVQVAVPRNWISGVYVAVLTNSSKYQSLVPFWVVEADRRSDLLYISSLNTYEAYNDFPYDPKPSEPSGLPQTGHSLYDFSSANGTPAVKVTFDRPFSAQYGGPGDGGLYDFEPELIAFIERSGYDVTYANEPVSDAAPWILERHDAVVIGGHAEYQTLANYDGLYAARNSGVGLAFISGNEIYWQVRYEPSLSGVPRRVMVGYKKQAPDPIANPALRTINWRDLGRPEQKLIGVQLPTNGFQNWGGQPWVPLDTNYWAFAGTGLRQGVPVKAEISGYEIDAFDPSVGKPDGTDYRLLSSSPFLTVNNQWYTQNSSIYRSRAGNWVWASGSMDWAWALTPGGSSEGRNNVRPCIEVMTTNILDRMLADAPANRSHFAGARSARPNLTPARRSEAPACY